MIKVREENDEEKTLIIEDRFARSIAKIKFSDTKFKSCIVEFGNSLRKRVFCAMNMDELRFIRDAATISIAKQIDVNIKNRKSVKHG